MHSVVFTFFALSSTLFVFSPLINRYFKNNRFSSVFFNVFQIVYFLCLVELCFVNVTSMHTR